MAEDNSVQKEGNMEYTDILGQIRDAGYQTKDSGKRVEFESGMVRDTQEGKARFALLVPKGVPYQEQMLTRFAELMARGAGKYGDRNWEKARGEAELERYYDSAFRHFMQWVSGETDEDHAAAVLFNIVAGETVKFKMRRRVQVTQYGDVTEFRSVADPEMC